MSSQKSVKLPTLLVKQLGKRADSELAREFNVPVYDVRLERRRRNIGSSTRIEWTAKKIALLGTMSDAAVAKKLDLWTTTVFEKRVSLNIAPFNPTTEQVKFQWKSAHLKRLGKEPDSQIAKDLGISVSVVTAKRHSLAISSSRATSNVRHPWTKQEISMLGKRPDTAVSTLTGRGRRHVRSKRESLGIPPFQVQRSIQWTNAIVKQLGKVSDQELADSLGVSVGTVSLYRRQKGIQSVGKGDGKSSTRERNSK